MNSSEVISAVDTNHWQAWRLMTEACGGDVLDGGDLIAVATGAPVAMLNVAFVLRSLAEPERALQEAVKFFDERDLPFVLRVREGVDPRAEQVAEDMGMPYSDTVPGMALFPIPETPRPVEGLAIETVRDERTLALFNKVMSEGFGMPLEIATRLLTAAILQQPSAELYLGYWDGEPVATATLIVTGSTAGVYNVVTVEAYRRRGIGEAMTWHCISRGRQSACSLAALQTSQMGQSVYERMGFRMVAPYRTYRRSQ